MNGSRFICRIELDPNPPPGDQIRLKEIVIDNS